ncbi:MAG: FadR family transcriptional regulator [Atopobiaceae bacterium]|nr:FadR family transcriptional regulator [Atopobiaceae bacterium]
MQYSTLFEDLPKGSLSQIIINRITDALISGELKPGDKIPTETEFSENLGVGRNAVREAIKVLEAFGVLEIRRAKGTYVVEEYNNQLLNPLIYGLILSERSMDELLDLKISLSNSVTYLVLLNATDEEVEQLRNYGEDFRRTMLDAQSTDEQCYKASIAFNVYLSEICHNKLLAELDAIVHKIASFTRHTAIENSRKIGETHLLPDNYMKQVEVIAGRDATAIPAFMEERRAVWEKLLL